MHSPSLVTRPLGENPTSIALMKLLLGEAFRQPQLRRCLTRLDLVVHSFFNSLSGKADGGWRAETYEPRSGSALFRWFPSRVSSHAQSRSLTRSRSAPMMVKTAARFSARHADLPDARLEAIPFFLALN